MVFLGGVCVPTSHGDGLAVVFAGALEELAGEGLLTGGFEPPEHAVPTRKASVTASRRSDRIASTYTLFT